MLFKNRRWSVATVPTAEDLAEKLTAHTWCGCQGFRVEGTDYLFLCDATGGDRAQEFGAIKGTPDGPPWVQVESITFSWCTYDRALHLIREVLAGAFDSADYAVPVTLSLDTPETHGTCRLCA